MKRIIMDWFNKHKLHLLIWALFISYETVVIGLVSGTFGHPLTYVAHYIAILFLFYLHADVFLPWALLNKKSAIWKLPVMLALEITGFVIFSYCIDKLLIMSQVMPYFKPFNLSYLYSLKMLYRGIYFLGFATGYYFLITYNKEKRRTNELEKQHFQDIINSQKAEQELTKAQNAFLKAQINPHFLFNTLDFIYHNIDASSPVAADAVIVLTEMMRYAVDADKMGDFICLGDEIDQAENLLYLSQMRKNHALGLRLNYEEETRHINLIPLVLLTLVENIFKHGNLNEPQHEAFISIYVERHTFHIVTNNLIKYESSENGYQSGLNNIKKRLKYAYGNEVEFAYHTDETNHFRLHLSVPMECLKANDGSSIALKDIDTGLLHGSADQN